MTQLRRSITPELSALLRDNNRLQVADLYTITLSGGQVLRWTNIDQAVVIGADTWVIGPGLSRGMLEMSAGVEAQAMDMTITADASQTINGQPMVPFILAGGFDGAEVVLDKAFRADLGAAPWVGKIEQFFGRVSDVESAGRLQVRVTVRSVLELFNLPLPPTVYQPQCRNSLYDANCGRDPATYTVTGFAQSASDGLRMQFAHNLLPASGYFDLGAITFVTGANAGIRRTVRQHSTTHIVVMQPWPAPVAVGDEFQVYPGCNLTLETCTSKFANSPRFRGHPFIPPPETVI